jgi:hypothetical protein
MFAYLLEDFFALFAKKGMDKQCIVRRPNLPEFTSTA